MSHPRRTWCEISLLVACLAVPAAQAVEPDDDVWIVSTRSIGCLDAAQLEDDSLAVRRYDATNCLWEHATLEELVDAPPKPIWIWVHGNRVSSGPARTEGLAWHATIAQHGGPQRPFRLVIWSWPSDQIRGPLRDVRAKAARADWEADYLGWFLVKLPPQRTVNLVGFSYGSRVIAGALDRLDGTRRWQALLLAAATPHDWMLPGRPHGTTLAQVRRLYVMVNPCDRALRRFAMVDRCTRPVALGFAGSADGIASAWRGRLDERAGGDVGSVHDMWAYRAAASTHEVVREMWKQITPCEAAPRSVRKTVDQLDRARRDRLVGGIRVGETRPR